MIAQGIPANKKRWANADLKLAHRVRRSPTLGQRHLFTRIAHVGSTI